MLFRSRIIEGEPTRYIVTGGGAEFEVAFPKSRSLADVLATINAMAPPNMEPPPAEIEDVSNMRKRLALARTPHPTFGTMLQAVEVLISQVGGEAKILWEYSAVVSRSNPTLAQLTAALGLKDAEVDDLFRTAASLTV